MQLTEDQVYELETLLKHSQNYLNKMKQWKEGKIDLTVPGCDPPRVMSDDEVNNDKNLVSEWLMALDELSTS